MSNAAAETARRRLRAREAGRCITCFTAATDVGRSACRSCSNAAAQRTARRRTEKRRASGNNLIADAHERAGDEAYAHHLYADAAAQYRQALDISADSSARQLQISEKLASALSFGRDPSSANPYLDIALAAHLHRSIEPERVIEMFLLRARQLFIDARTQDALPLISQAIELAEDCRDIRLCKLTNGRMANYLIGLGRFEEAEHCIEAMGQVGDADDVAIRATYHTQRGILAAARGKAIEAFEHFENAVRMAKDDSDLFGLISAWRVYGVWATVLGNIELAKSSFERALFVARQSHVTVLLPMINLHYADVLEKMGSYGLAYEHLVEALSYDVQAPFNDMWVVEIGLPLALRMNDDAIIARCLRNDAVAFAFRSGQFHLIQGVASAFAQWYATRGRVQKAQQLLHRAVRIAKRVIQSSELPLAIGRYGAKADIPRARALLQQLATLPNAQVAQAYLALFDAFVAQRSADDRQMHEHALEATQRFDTLGWRRNAEVASALCAEPVKTAMVKRQKSEPALGILPALTTREQEVAQFVLRGLTNREIAEQLAISKHTVESHVASIMGQLGIRSRYQLADLLNQ